MRVEGRLCGESLLVIRNNSHCLCSISERMLKTDKQLLEC